MLSPYKFITNLCKNTHIYFLEITSMNLSNKVLFADDIISNFVLFCFIQNNPCSIN